MEIDYRSLANLRGEDVIQVTSLTESHKYPFVAVKEAIIEMNDGKLYRVVATDENISGVTKEVQKLMHRAVIKQRLVPRDGKYAEFQQCEEGNLEDERKYDAVYDEYIKNLNSKDLIKIKNITYNEKKINTLTDEYNTIPTQISYMNSSYFDEIYFARTAYEYVNGIETYEWTHPPLGKLIQAIPIYITKNMTPFNYRLMGNISGIIMIIVMYSFGKLLFKKRKYACLSSLLMCFDTFHFVETRIGTVDSHLILFILLATYFMFKFTKYSNTKDLFFSGLFFSFSISTKWTGFYGGIAFTILLR